MKVLVTGHEGYVGCVLVPLLRAQGYDVIGLDTGLLHGCEFEPPLLDCDTIRKDIRDVRSADLEGFDGICHLAGISNDPLGSLNPRCTYDINHHATVTLAREARKAGVSRFLQASSCSVYGAAGNSWIDESGEPKPATPYGKSKLLAERDLSQLADDAFTPVFLRNATAYGLSPRLRCDLVVNSLVGYAYTTGRVLMKSDGMAWRPLIHVEDIARAIVAALGADRALVHNRVFNVGRTEENYRVCDIASMIEGIIPGARIEHAGAGSHDGRCYRVECRLIQDALPGFQPAWTVEQGIVELYGAYVAHGLTLEEFESSRYLRVRHVRDLQRRGALDQGLRWINACKAAAKTATSWSAERPRSAPEASGREPRGLRGSRPRRSDS